MNPSYRQALPIGHILSGEYRIEDILGVGGFGITYRARDVRLNLEVAIKEYFPSSFAVRETDTTVRSKGREYERDFEWGLKRFTREAEMLARFRHPHIVRVYRHFLENCTAYMVLEYVVGRDLNRWFADGDQRLDPATADMFVEKILDALEEIHAAGILHRDIKPANIYIRAEDNLPVLLDFGAARAVQSEHQASTNAVVSRHYSPHEAYMTDPSAQGAWTDIYGVAATVYRGVTGQPPPDAPDRLHDDRYVSLMSQRAHFGGFRRAFLSAIDAGLRVRPADRPQTVTVWRADLFGPEPAPPRDKRPMGAIAGLSALAILVAGGLGYLVALDQGLIPDAVREAPASPMQPTIRGETGTNRVSNTLGGDRAVRQAALPVDEPRVEPQPTLPKARQPSFAPADHVLGKPFSGAVDMLVSGGITGNGAHVVTLARDGALLVWDVAKAAERTAFWQPSPGTALAMVPRSNRFVTGGADGVVRLWDAEPAGLHWEEDTRAGVISAAAVSASGRRLITGHMGRAVKLWDLERRALITDLSGPTASIRAVAVSPDDRLAAAASMDGTVAVWSLETLTLVATLNRPARALAFRSQEGGRTQLVIASDIEPAVVLIDPAAPDQIVQRYEAARAVENLAVLAGGAAIAAGERDGSLRVWDAGSGAVRASATLGSRPVVALGGDDRETVVVAVADSGAIAVYPVEPGARLGQARPLASGAEREGLLAGGILGNGQALLVVGKAGALRRWDWARNRFSQPVPLSGGALQALALSDDGKRVAMAGGGDTIYVREVAVREGAGGDRPITADGWDIDRTRFGNAPPAAPVQAVAFHPRNGTLAFGSGDGRVFTGVEPHDRSTWQPPRSPMTPEEAAVAHTRAVTCLAYDGAGARLASTSMDGSIRLMDVETGAVLSFFRLPSRAWQRACALNRDGSLLAAAGGDGIVRLWRIGTDDNSPGIALAGQEGAVYALAISADGRWLVSGGADRIVRVWDLRERTIIQRFSGHADTVRWVGFIGSGPSNTRVVSVSEDGTARAWPLGAVAVSTR